MRANWNFCKFTNVLKFYVIKMYASHKFMKKVLELSDSPYPCTSF